MQNYKTIITNTWDRFGKFGKALAIIAGVITAYSTIEPVIKSTADKIEKVWTTQEKIAVLQSEVDTIQKVIKHQQEYILVLDGIVDGVLKTHYHRGVRYGKTEKGDVYYHTEDCDHIKKWMRAIYTAEKDEYGYIDHDGKYHVITPKKPSKILP